MSNGNRHKSSDISHPRMGGISFGRPGVYVGRKYVKRAGMWVDYTCYNDPKRSDKFEWKLE